MHQFVTFHGQMFMETMDGYMIPVASNAFKTKDMLVPVQCNHCSQIYDLCDGKVVHRYSDCTLFRTPCCDSLVDDRWEKDFKRLDKSHL